MAPIDVQQLVHYLPVETAVQAVADLRAQGLNDDADKLQSALQKKMDDLAAAAAKDEADAEDARQQALAALREQFDAEAAAFVDARDDALEHLAAYIVAAKSAPSMPHMVRAKMEALLKDEDYKRNPDGSIIDPLPELPESATSIV